MVFAETPRPRGVQKNDTGRIPRASVAVFGDDFARFCAPGARQGAPRPSPLLRRRCLTDSEPSSSLQCTAGRLEGDRDRDSDRPAGASSPRRGVRDRNERAHRRSLSRGNRPARLSPWALRTPDARTPPVEEPASLSTRGVRAQHDVQSGQFDLNSASTTLPFPPASVAPGGGASAPAPGFAAPAL